MGQSIAMKCNGSGVLHCPGRVLPFYAVACIKVSPILLQYLPVFHSSSCVDVLADNMASSAVWPDLGRNLVQDIGGGRWQASAKALAQESIQTRNYLGKEFYFANGGWKGVSDVSPQSAGQCQLFRDKGAWLTSGISEGSVIIDFGAGLVLSILIILELTLRRDIEISRCLLTHLEERGISCKYLAVDINRESLEFQIPKLAEELHYISCRGLYGTFDDALHHVKDWKASLVLWSLGSTATNFDERTVLETLWQWASLKPTSILIGQDAPPRSNTEACEHYHGSANMQFLISGLNAAIDAGSAVDDIWSLSCEINEKPWRHEWTVETKKTVHNSSLRLAKGFKFQSFSSYKFTKEEVYELTKRSGLVVEAVHKAANTNMRKSFRERRVD